MRPFWSLLGAMARHGLPEVAQMNPDGTADQNVVLIVDDQAAMRAGMRIFLQTAFPGCRIREADTGAGALAACLEHQPQLVLMDVCLPDANGIELTRRIKVLFRNIKVIVVSYLSGRAYVEQALAAGALCYIAKDNLVDELIPAVATALGLKLPAVRRR
jgi:DNA-binding NarL/FixJ family response regulator